jgi:hypothetical protein
VITITSLGKDVNCVFSCKKKTIWMLQHLNFSDGQEKCTLKILESLERILQINAIVTGLNKEVLLHSVC